MEFDSNNDKYKPSYITIRLSKMANHLLSEACQRSNRKKIQEAKLRLEDHLSRFRSISELNHAVPYCFKDDSNDNSQDK